MYIIISCKVRDGDGAQLSGKMMRGMFDAGIPNVECNDGNRWLIGHWRLLPRVIEFMALVLMADGRTHHTHQCALFAGQ